RGAARLGRLDARGVRAPARGAGRGPPHPHGRREAAVRLPAVGERVRGARLPRPDVARLRGGRPRGRDPGVPRARPAVRPHRGAGKRYRSPSFLTKAARSASPRFVPKDGDGACDDLSFGDGGSERAERPGSRAAGAGRRGFSSGVRRGTPSMPRRIRRPSSATSITSTASSVPTANFFAASPALLAPVHRVG